MIIRFQPRAITEALKDIRVKHPIVKGQHGEPPESLIEKVRRLLRDTPHDEIRLLARVLTPQQLKTCLFLLGDEDVGSKALEVLLQRPRPDIYIQGWKLLVRTYPASAALQQLVNTLSDSIGTDALVSAGAAPPYVAQWVKEDTLAAGVYMHYRRNGGNRTCDEYLLASGIRETDGLFSGAWRQLLTTGTAKELLAQEGQRILMELLKPTTGGEAKAEYGRHYLNTLRTLSKWHVPILEYIAKRYGKPAGRTEHEDPFWKAINDPVKSEFLKWHLNQQILDFFEGERADFWRYFVNEQHVLNVRKTLAGKGFMLDFERFGVVEFKDIGNAAYIYPAAVFHTYWDNAQDYYNPSQMKDRSRTIRGVGNEGRIIHKPRGDWQQQAQNEIERLLRRL